MTILSGNEQDMLNGLYDFVQENTEPLCNNCLKVRKKCKCAVFQGTGIPKRRR